MSNIPLLIRKEFLDKNKKWSYVYHLIDPTDSSIRYVGKSKTPDLRFKAHISEARSKKGAHKKKNIWIKSLLDKKMLPIIRIVAVCTLNFINSAEISEISKYPNLTNIVRGGNGGNYEMCAETKAKISKARLGSKPWNKGRISTKEERKNLSAAHNHQKIAVIDQYGTVYESISQASEAIRAQKTHIMSMINGKCAHVKGFIFRKL